MACALCEKRTERRFCLALHERICPQCCGEQREVTIACVSECDHLRQARLHEKARTAADLEGVELFREIEISQRFYYDHEPLIAGLMFGIAQVAHAHPGWTDQEMLRALESVTRTVITRTNSGLIIEEPTPNPAQQALAAEIVKLISEYRKVEEQHVGHHTLKDSDVMRALVFLVRMSHARTNGRPKSCMLVDSLRAQFPVPHRQPIAGEAARNIIIP